ncbi:uncharacterized protein [Aegilops tauschii subsp. strangulata]|uniref:uncharacterized protein n=1 Tax=Aegilops tauschii subsp. strangulata TaxID=200361 RepID=UPI00098B55C2|nr:uncharacterized protein LOC109739097 [Aegilops tauschii subsp. strangulata]
MVLEDESSDDNSSLPYMYSETSTDGLNQASYSIGARVRVPFSLEDPDYKGLELDLMSFCDKYGKPSERLVAFEGTMTRRRFLACAEPEGQNCGFVQWVDEQWPPTMENELLKLWSMVEESKSARVNDNLESALTIHHLTEEKNKLDADYDKAELVAGMKAEMAKKDAVTEKLQQKYELLCNLTSAQATVIQNLELKNMTEKELLSEARMNLELKNAEFTKFEEKLTQEKLELKFQVADLLKLKETHNEKKYMLELKISELMKAEEMLKGKIKGIQAILQN